MALISSANLLLATDKIGSAWRILKAQLGLSTAAAGNYTAMKALTNLQTLYLSLADAQQVQSLLTTVLAGSISRITADGLASQIFSSQIESLGKECQEYGGSVAASINSLDTFLTYYNGGSGGVKFAGMVTNEFGVLYQLLTGTYLTYPNAVSESINPTWDSTYTNGMGAVNVAASFTSGTAVTNSRWGEGLPIVQVSTTFTGGGAAPIITVAGTDDTAATSTTWSVTLTGNNPATAISQQTISSGALSAQTRNTVTVGSTAGIVPGSVVVINTGLIDEEVTVVEAVPSGTTMTITCQKAHGASSLIDGKTSATLAPSVGTRRIRSVSGITITGGGGWGAGAVRICCGAAKLGI